MRSVSWVRWHAEGDTGVEEEDLAWLELGTLQIDQPSTPPLGCPLSPMHASLTYQMKLILFWIFDKSSLSLIRVRMSLTAFGKHSPPGNVNSSIASFPLFSGEDSRLWDASALTGRADGDFSLLCSTQQGCSGNPVGDKLGEEGYLGLESQQRSLKWMEV